jgi:hypothetical protein
MYDTFVTTVFLESSYIIQAIEMLEKKINLHSQELK